MSSKKRDITDVNTDVMYKEYYKGNLDSKSYKQFLYAFNKEVFKRILNNNEVLRLPFKLGIIEVFEYDRKFRRSKVNNKIVTSINWMSSKMKKKEIIERGGTPLEMIKDENGKILGDNGGEEWMIYNTSDKVRKIGWNKILGDNGKYRLPFVHVYKFVPTRKNIVELNRICRENPDISYAKREIA